MAKILIIEDERAIAESIKLNLEHEGYEVVIAGDGVDGLEVVQKAIPDLIILDVLLPRMDGFQFYKELKRLPLTNRIPLLVMTVRGAMRDSFEGLGVEAFINKPFDPDHLIGQVKKVLSVGTTSGAPSVSVPPSHLTALIVGHQPRRIDNIRMALLAKGYKVEITTDGAHALEKILKLAPDMLFIQKDIAQLDVENIIKIFNRYPLAKRISVIVYSPLATQEELALLKQGQLVSKDVKKETAITVKDKFDAKSFLDKINNLSP